MVMVVVLATSDQVLAGSQLTTAHLLTNTHLVVLILFLYAQIVPICYATFVLY
jgi:hypothetical protein